MITVEHHVYQIGLQIVCMMTTRRCTVLWLKHVNVVINSYVLNSSRGRLIYIYIFIYLFIYLYLIHYLAKTCYFVENYSCSAKDIISG